MADGIYQGKQQVEVIQPFVVQCSFDYCVPTYSPVFSEYLNYQCQHLLVITLFVAFVNPHPTNSVLCELHHNNFYRQQTQLQLQSKAKGVKLPYSGMISGLTYTVRTTGFISLYRGLAPTLIGSMPKAGIRFGLNSIIKDKLRDKDGKLTPAKNFVAGLGAGVTEALIIVAPVETVKTKCIELNQPFVKGFLHILKTEGLAGVYQGAVATALKQGSNQGLRFMWFNEYKRIVTKEGEVPLTPLMGLLGGMSAGCFSTLGNNPFDVVKVSSVIFSLAPSVSLKL